MNSFQLGIFLYYFNSNHLGLYQGQINYFLNFLINYVTTCKDKNNFKEQLKRFLQKKNSHCWFFFVYQKLLNYQKSFGKNLVILQKLHNKCNNIWHKNNSTKN